jgi:chorismate mutase
MNLEQLRKKINKIDKEIIDLLSRRQSLMPAVGAYKKKHGLPIHQAAREKEVLASLGTLAAKKKVDPALTHTIFKSIFKNSKKIQRQSKD